MKLEDIGFYTLSNNRFKYSSVESPLYRGELILTNRCNFKCPYCRPMRNDCIGDISFGQANKIIDLWIKEDLKNIRFSGGEPTLYDGLKDLVIKCKENKVERIAISTNGSASFNKYKELIDAGVNDLSISLDACCASVGNLMAGGIKVWDRVVENIKEISKITYVSVGMVFTEKNVDSCLESVIFADSLGVKDIRVIPSAQYNMALKMLGNLSEEILNKYPILKYRINNIKNNIPVRGMKNSDSDKCYIVLDDVAVAGEYHFPCIIYFREGGEPIGKMENNWRFERGKWFLNHRINKDKICLNNCIDCLILANNIAKNCEYHF